MSATVETKAQKHARAEVLEYEADVLLAQAGVLRAQALEKRKEAAALVAETSGSMPTSLADEGRKDPLLAAAILAAEGLPEVFTAAALAKALELPESEGVRAVYLCAALVDMGLIRKHESRGTYALADPDLEIVRDAVVAFGEQRFTATELAERSGVPVSQCFDYLEELTERGIVEAADVDREGATIWRYVVPGPERSVTRRFNQPTAEELAIAEAIKRGEPVPHTGTAGFVRGKAQQNAKLSASGTKVLKRTMKKHK